MRCDELRGLLDLYLDSELPEEMASKVDRHLLRCPTCAYEARTLEQTRTMLRAAVPPAETSPGFRERAAARLLDALSTHLRPAPEKETGRQWALPFTQEEQR
jgi:anti-sigma factor RsiW